MINKKIALTAWAVITLLLSSGQAMAAICTTNAGAGTWGTAATWSCGHVPVAADSVVISRAITLSASTTIAGLTVNPGITFNDGNRTLTITGGLTNNGTITGGGDMNVTGAASVIDGSGTYTDSRLYISGAAPAITAGAVLNFTGSSRIYTGRSTAGNALTSVLTINGTINSTVATATTTFLRFYANSTVIGATGIINASVSSIRFYTATTTVTNNGSVNVNSITANAASNSWTQAVNSSLTVSAASTVGTLNASANGNTVTYNGTSTVIQPSAAGYWNLAGTIFPGACPVAYPVSGNSPCPTGGPVSLTMNPGSCANTVGVGTVAWAPTPTTNVNLNDALYATAAVNAATTNYLKCTGYNFAVPSNATILGVTVNVVRKSSGNRTTDGAMRLVNAAGVIGAVDRSTTTVYTAADVSEAHGSSVDLWGGAWTPADINNANFGAAFAAKSTRTRTISVNYMPITVTYAPPVIDHVSINAPATAMTLAEVPVNIAPHTTAHGAIPAAGTFDLSTSTGTGDWTIGTGTGTLTPGAANSGLASYTFAAGESSVTLGFTSQAAGAVTLNVASGGVNMLLNTPVAEKANTITFSAASFVFTSSACTHNVAIGTAGQCGMVVWSPRTAGQSLGNVYITVVNASGVPVRLHPTQARTLDMQFGLSCHDPAANAGVRATFSATAVALPLCQANGAQPTSWTAAVTLSFPGGSPSVGPYSFNYDDVGKVELWTQDSAPTSGAGTSGQFVVKPAGFTLSNIKRTSDNFANPGAADAAGAAFVKAGEAFTATVTATNASGVATPNYGKEIVAESVKLLPALKAGLGLTNNPAITCANSTNAAICDTTTTPGTNIPKLGAFSNGIATGVNFAWDEVGIITLTPQVGDGSYLGVGDVTGTTSGNVGRFSLGKFALQNVDFDNRADLCDGVVCNPAFTYMGEQINANFTLVPKSLSGATVQNYVDSATAANDFAKLDPTVFANLNLAAVDYTTAGGPYYLTGRLSNVAMPVVACLTALCFESGSADVVVPFTFARGVAADGPYDADIGIAMADGDGARVEGAGAMPGLCNNPNATDCYDLDSDASAGNDRALLASTEFRYGRARISNAYGSELLPLRLPTVAEYWNGTMFVTNTDDSISVISTTLGNYRRNLSAGETMLAQPAITNGVGYIRLSAPGASNNGSVDVTVTAPSYLPGNTGRATFGVYKGSNEFIYLREAY